MRNTLASLALVLLVLGLVAVPSFGQWFADLENGLAVPGYNDVRIPNATGTSFSLSADLEASPAYYARVRLGFQWKGRHTVSVFAAPLTLKAAGSVDREILFNGDVFAPGVALAGRYMFNSYRLTYRYDFVRKGKWRVGAGLTAKIRDAAIALEGGGTNSVKTNVGFVPLINFRVLWQFRPSWSLLLEGDAAAAKQGRAEDVQLALQYRLNDRLTLRAGYRLLEGGANVDEVYNFALVHFFGAGLRYEF
jgi:signal transduction histidine kinase